MDTKKRVIRFLNKNVLPVDNWTVSVTFLTVCCIGFDIYQLMESDNEWLSAFGIFCLVVNWFGLMKWASDELSAYLLLYLVPSCLLILSSLPNGEQVGISQSQFELSAYTTLITTLLPLVGGIVLAVASKLVGDFSRFLEKK